MYKFKIVLVSLISALVISSVGCGLTPTSTITQTRTIASTTATVVLNGGADSPGFLDYSSVVEKVRPSVVQVETDVAAGSGWVVDSNGIIVTNAHVLEDGAGGIVPSSSIKVITSDNHTYIATSIKTDVSSDLAIIRIKADGLVAANIGNSSALRVRQPVAAIGNALDLGISMTGGWVSRLNATVTDENGVTHTDLIGTDTAINPGNSGGPLVDTSGNVVGITSIKLIDTGVEGVGYAISIDSAMPVINQLINRGFVARAYMGVNGLTTVDSIVVSQNNLGTDTGVFIGGVVAGSPADKAGLKAKDVIVDVDGVPITTNGQLVQLIQAKSPGTQVNVSIFRGPNQLTIVVTLGSTPAPTS